MLCIQIVLCPLIQTFQLSKHPPSMFAQPYTSHAMFLARWQQLFMSEYSQPCVHFFPPPQFNCCGIDGAADWRNNSMVIIGRGAEVPGSCCPSSDCTGFAVDEVEVSLSSTTTLHLSDSDNPQVWAPHSHPLHEWHEISICISCVPQGCLTALQQFVSNNLLIIASVAIAFLVGEVSLYLNSTMTHEGSTFTHILA